MWLRVRTARRVSLNGKPQRRSHSQDGRLRISNLEPNQYNIEVTEDGYEKTASQIAHIQKGEELTLTFELKPVPHMAALSIQGALAGAEVSLDGKTLGTVGPDGTLSASDIVPGEHTVEFRKEGFQPKQVRQQFDAGQMQTVNGNQEQLLGALLLDVSPPAAELTLRRQGETSGVAITPGRRDMPPGNYTVTARWSSGREQTLPLAVMAGETFP